jgi:hypothetical protein
MSRSSLFEAKKIYTTFSRFGKIINGRLDLVNIEIPPQLSKKHLLLISKYCLTSIQEDVFIEKIIHHSLNSRDLKLELIRSLPVKIEGNDTLLCLDGLDVKQNYDFSCFQILDHEKEKEIEKRLIEQIGVFIKIVLGTGSGWSYLPFETIFFGGRNCAVDLCFYSTVHHRFCIVELKENCNKKGAMDGLKNQIAGYVKGYDKKIDLRFQKKTIGLVLGKKPLDKEYFFATQTIENIFYVGFDI